VSEIVQLQLESASLVLIVLIIIVCVCGHWINSAEDLLRDSTIVSSASDMSNDEPPDIMTLGRKNVR